MELQHRKLINAYLPDLVVITYDVQSVVNRLLDKTIINQWMHDYILDSSISELSKKERLYQIIQGRGPMAFSALCKTLEETKNINARKLLQISKNIINVNDIHIAMKNFKLTIDEDEEPYVKVHPDRKRMDVNDDSTPTGVYPMGSNPKGNAFILNINKTVGRKDREGSDVDVISLEKLFKSLGYIIQSEIDLTYNQTIDAIKAFVEKCKHKRGDSVVIFIMSHGEAGKDSSRSSDILTTDGLNINTDWMVEKIGSEEIFKSIPKLFFIQACRGINNDFGFANSVHKNVLQHDDTNTNNVSIGKLVNRRYENVFIAYATVPGYSAKRHPKNGSWFVQKLCQVIRNNSWQFDIDSIMRMVDVEIRSLNCILYGFQTVEWTYRGFNKKFYFNPGLYDDNNSDCNTPEITSADPVNT